MAKKCKHCYKDETFGFFTLCCFSSTFCRILGFTVAISSNKKLNQCGLLCIANAQCFTHYPSQLMMSRGKRARKSNNKLYAKRLYVAFLGGKKILAHLAI